MIHVVATIRTAPGRRDEVLREFQRMVPLVRAETGCLEYVPTLDVATGIAGLPAARADVFTVVEKWESEAALAAHLVAPHVLRYRDAVKELLADIEIRVTQPA